MRNVICFLIIFVTGCCDMNAVMSSWEGCNLSEVIAQWGYPDSQQEIAGRTIYRWGDVSSFYMPQTSYTTGHINSYGNYYGNTNYYGGYSIPLSCVRTLEVNDSGYVVSWQWEGNNCSNSGWKNKNKAMTNYMSQDYKTAEPFSLQKSNEEMEQFDVALYYAQLAAEQEKYNAQQYPEQSEPNTPNRKFKGYQAGIDSKTGKVVTYPVYEDEQEK